MQKTQRTTKAVVVLLEVMWDLRRHTCSISEPISFSYFEIRTVFCGKNNNGLLIFDYRIINVVADLHIMLPVLVGYSNLAALTDFYNIVLFYNPTGVFLGITFNICNSKTKLLAWFFAAAWVGLFNLLVNSPLNQYFSQPARILLFFTQQIQTVNLSNLPTCYRYYVPTFCSFTLKYVISFSISTYQKSATDLIRLCSA